jgi:polyhydroxyalkanoate synthesis regulator phasin
MNRWTELFYTAVGFVAKSRSSVQDAIQQLTDDRKISAEEGKKIYADFVKDTEVKREELEQQLGKIVERIAHNLNLATTQQLEDLQNKVESLEKRVQDLERKGE